jgi:hypothetical protein
MRAATTKAILRSMRLPSAIDNLVDASLIAIASIALSVAAPAHAQSTAEPQQAQPSEALPPVTVTALETRRRAVAPTPSRRADRRVQRQRRQQAARRPTEPPSVQASGADSSSAINAGNSAPALQQVASLGKTGTKLQDLPASVQIVPREVANQQGVTTLRDTVYNASGINFGGQDSLGYFDHFLIRGLNALVFSDGFSDGDQLGWGLALAQWRQTRGDPGGARLGPVRQRSARRHHQYRALRAVVGLPLGQQHSGGFVRHHQQQ